MAEIPDLFSPAFIENPYPTYRHLQQTAPFFRMEGTELWVATRYEDCAFVLRDRRFGHRMAERIERTLGPDALKEPARASLLRTMLFADPPDHTRLRGLVAKAFDRKGVERMRQRIRTIANDLVDAMLDQKAGNRGEGDLVRLFNHPLPVLVICDMLGIPEADWPLFTAESRVRGRIIDPTPMTPEEMAESNGSVLQSEAYFAALLEDRRRQPRDDLLTALVESETEHGILTREEVIANVGLLFAAGHETTVNLLGNGLLALYRHPDQLAALRADPSLLPGAVEEMLRYESSVQMSGRSALEDVAVAGVTIPAGHQVLTVLGAANRDESVFEDPDRLDVRRPGVKPLSFGGGIHFCLGAQLARIEAVEALGVLFDRLPDLELTRVDEPDWKETITLRGLKTLPASW